MHRRPWTADEIESVRINYADWPTYLIAYLLRRSERSVFQLAAKLRIRKSERYYQRWRGGRWNGEHPNSVKHRYTKGNVPANKGLRRPGWAPGRMASTQFKKGQRPQTWQPIGSEVVDRDGYRKRKVRDDAPPGLSRFNWIYCHVALWEEHLGPVPPGHCIVFKNGNKSDIRIDNLACISQRQNMRRNSLHNYPKPIVRMIQLRGALNRQINRRTKRERQQHQQ